MALRGQKDKGDGMKLRGVCFGLLSVALVGCGDDLRYSGVGTLAEEGSEQTPQDAPPERVTQPLIPKVDVLWVVDNSGSMCEEQASLKDNFDIFVRQLTTMGADFQLAVVTTDMMNPEHSGRFQNVPDDGLSPACSLPVDIRDCPSPLNGQAYPSLILRSRDYVDEGGEVDVARLERDFACNATVGTSGDGFEMGLEAARAALSPSLLTGFNNGFLRDDALLAIIFLTDENDCSRRDAFNRSNGNACEWESDMLVPEETYIDFFLGLKGGDMDKLFLAGIIAPDSGLRFAPGREVQPACSSELGGAAYAGYRYEAVVEGVAHGEVRNICEMPFRESLGELGLRLSEQLR